MLFIPSSTEPFTRKRCLCTLTVLILLIGLIGPVSAAVTLEVLNPRGEIKPPPIFVPTSRIPDLAGKKIAIYWIGKQGGNNFFDVIEEMLKQKFPTTKTVRYNGGFDVGDKLASTIAKECDVIIYGVGD